jgi:hypothetical protein
MRWGLVTLAGFVLASCASVETAGDRATRQLDNAVAAYIAAHRAQEGFPPTKQEFAAWAAKHNLPLDLSAFTQLDWYPHKKVSSGQLEDCYRPSEGSYCTLQL